MLKEKIKEAKEKYNSLVHERSALLENANKATEAKDLHEIRSQISDKNKALEETKAEIEDLENLQTEEKRSFEPEVKGPHHRGGGSTVNKRDVINNYLHTFLKTRDSAPVVQAGLVSKDAEVTIPDGTEYVPKKKVNTVVDLSQLVTKTKVTTHSGNYPILKRATAKLHSVQELEKNPDLAKPEFEKVSWEVVTYRGSIPVSQESIDDSAIDLLGIVAQNAEEQRINTTNDAISAQLKGFTPKTVTGDNVDGLKHILNVDLDPAYNKVFVASQSFYNYLDTLKDKNGRYMLTDSISAPAAKGNILGCPVYVVNDELLGNAGESHAFVGDLNRAILYADRAQTTVKWVDNDIYGTYLALALRFGVSTADSKAGYFLSVGTVGN